MPGPLPSAMGAALPGLHVGTNGVFLFFFLLLNLAMTLHCSKPKSGQSEDLFKYMRISFQSKFKYFQKETTFPIPLLRPSYNRTVFGILGKRSNVRRGSERPTGPGETDNGGQGFRVFGGKQKRTMCLFKYGTHGIALR